MLRNRFLVVIESVLNRFDLSFTVHVQCFLNKGLLDIVSDLSFNFLHRLRLETRLFSRNVFRFTQPGNTSRMVFGSRWILWRVHIFFQQFLIGRIQLRIEIGLIKISIDQINCDAQIMLRQHFVFVVAFQWRRVVLNEAVVRERISYEFQIERYVWQRIAIFHTANELGSEKQSRTEYLISNSSEIEVNLKRNNCEFDFRRALQPFRTYFFSTGRWGRFSAGLLPFWIVGAIMSHEINFYLLGEKLILFWNKLLILFWQRSGLEWINAWSWFVECFECFECCHMKVNLNFFDSSNKTTKFGKRIDFIASSFLSFELNNLILNASSQKFRNKVFIPLALRLTHSASYKIRAFRPPNSEVVIVRTQAIVDESRHGVRHYPHHTIWVNLGVEKKYISPPKNATNSFRRELHSNLLDRSFSCHQQQAKDDFRGCGCERCSSNWFHSEQPASKIWLRFCYRSRAWLIAYSVHELPEEWNLRCGMTGWMLPRSEEFL